MDKKSVFNIGMSVVIILLLAKVQRKAQRRLAADIKEAYNESKLSRNNG